jgi:hypothetical protein
VFAIAGRGITAHLIVNSPSGKLADSDLETNDMAVHICPVGAILIKEHGYEVPIGRRTFDLHQVGEIGLEKVILANGHGKYAIPDDETHHARFPLPNPLNETTSHSTKLQKTAAKSLVIPQAGEGANESLRELHFDVRHTDE